MEILSSVWGMLLIGWAPYLAFGGGVLYLGARYVRAVERRSATRAELDEMRERLLRLEEGVAGVAAETERLAEGQRFTARVLAERPAPGDVRPPAGLPRAD